MAESGVFRTVSGRETYYADGYGPNPTTTTTTTTTYSTHSTHVSDARQNIEPTASTASSDLSSVSTPANDVYITEEGKEAAEDPQATEKGQRNSLHDRGYEPINPGDEGVLTRLATQMSRPNRSRSNTGASTQHSLERSDTLAGVEIGDPVLDPASPKFDLRTYIRMVMNLLDREGIKIKQAGLTFKDVNVSGKGAALNVQSNVGSVFMAPLRVAEHLGRKPEKRILRNFNGMLRSGEMLIVLGRPGSGCSTFLKTVTGEMHGLDLDNKSIIHYNGVPQKRMMKEFKGEVIYNQEVDKHFPHLTVGETLEHAVRMDSLFLGRL